MPTPLSKSKRIPVQQPHDIILESETPYPDEPLNVKIQAEFIHESGSRTRQSAFWNGGTEWRLRFAPSLLGRWSYTVINSNQTGEIECTPAEKPTRFTKHGRVSASPSSSHFRHADATPFLYLADTAWNGCLRPSLSEWKTYLQNRQQKGFTAIQCMITPWRACKTNQQGEKAYTEKNPIRINPKFFSQLDSYIAEINRHNMLAVLAPFWAVPDWTGRNPGSSLSVKDLCKLGEYVTARYAAYHVMWILGGDGLTHRREISKWKQVGNALFPDATSNPVTTHARACTFPGSRFHDCDWLNGWGYQSGHGESQRRKKWLQSGAPAQADQNRITLNMEPDFEGLTPYLSLSRTPISAIQTCRSIWYSLLNHSISGVAYGCHGIWNFAPAPEVPLAHPGTGKSPAALATLDAPGAKAVNVISEVMNQLDWTHFRPLADYAGWLHHEPAGQYLGYIEQSNPAPVPPPIHQPINVIYIDPLTGHRMEENQRPDNQITSPFAGDAIVLINYSKKN